ncbi:Vitamin B12 import ATP-binding protein BtuD [Streptomyces alboniger]
MSNPDELLRIEGIRKTFPGVVALDGVDFDLRRGEVHVLLGENGAGKSTLIKMLSGAYTPDGGRILAGGEEVRIHGAQDSERLGIATIYQEFTLVPDLTVAENIFLGGSRAAWGMIDRKRMESWDAAVLLERVGVNVSPRVRRTRHRTPPDGRDREGASLDARVLIMDEPTAVLTSEEVDKLFAIVRTLRADGVGVVFITHHLEEIAALGDPVTVIRDGRSVGQVPATTPADELVRLMVGRSIEQQDPRERADRGAALLSVEGLTRDGVFHDVSFEVHAGEVVGVAGLVGAGRTEVVRAVFGADRYDKGAVKVAPRSPGLRQRGHDRGHRSDPRGPQGPGAGPRRLLDNGALTALIVLVIAMSALSGDFMTTDNLLNVGVQAAVTAILAFGVTFVIVSAGIDLSVGSVAARRPPSARGAPPRRASRSR